jgi:RNA polymerase sigma-70 factor, ECF subfamily
MKLLRATSVGAIPSSAARFEMEFVSASPKVTATMRNRSKIKAAQFFVSTVTFQSRPSNSANRGRSEPWASWRSWLRGLREVVEVGEDSNSAIHRMPSGDNLEMLMVRYQQGDFAAATDLIRHISPALHRFFLAKSLSRTDADDLLQETWLRIHKVRHTYRPGEPALPWFYAIARHIRVDHYRKFIRTAGKERGLEEISNAVSAAPQQAGALEALLAPLPESQREILAMLKVEGMSLEEVARATSSSVGSVKQKVHRAYKKLRETIGAASPRKWRSEELR